MNKRSLSNTADVRERILGEKKEEKMVCAV